MRLRVAWMRLRSDPASAVALSLVWAGACAIGVLLLVGAARRLPVSLLERPGSAVALLVFVLAYVDQRRAGVAMLRHWRLGWLAALPTLAPRVPAALARRLAVRALLASALIALLPALHRGGALLPVGWLPVLAAPWMAAALAWWQLHRRSALQLLEHAQPVGASAVAGFALLPPLARWQQVAASMSARGVGGARVFGALLLLVPFGLGLNQIVATLALLALAGSLLAAWSAALRTLAQAAILLRSTPWPARAFLRAGLALPAAMLLLTVVSVACAMMLAGVPRMAWLLAAGVAAVGLLHASVVAAERFRPGRIGPLLALQLGLQVAVLQTAPPLAPALLAVQVAWLWRRALQR